MLDMRDALTTEVADKHDTILTLRREITNLEEQCRKADQKTHFKDNIIKELRKDIKQLKQQVNVVNINLEIPSTNHLQKNTCYCSMSPSHTCTGPPPAPTNSSPPTKHEILPSDNQLSTLWPPQSYNPTYQVPLTIEKEYHVTENLSMGENMLVKGSNGVISHSIKKKYLDRKNQTLIYICEDSSTDKRKETLGHKEVLPKLNKGEFVNLGDSKDYTRKNSTNYGKNIETYVGGQKSSKHKRHFTSNGFDSENHIVTKQSDTRDCISSCFKVDIPRSKVENNDLENTCAMSNIPRHIRRGDVETCLKYSDKLFDDHSTASFKCKRTLNELNSCIVDTSKDSLESEFEGTSLLEDENSKDHQESEGIEKNILVPCNDCIFVSDTSLRKNLCFCNTNVKEKIAPPMKSTTLPKLQYEDSYKYQNGLFNRDKSIKPSKSYDSQFIGDMNYLKSKTSHNRALQKSHNSKSVRKHEHQSKCNENGWCGEIPNPDVSPKFYILDQHPERKLKNGEDIYVLDVRENFIPNYNEEISFNEREICGHSSPCFVQRALNKKKLPNNVRHLELSQNNFTGPRRTSEGNIFQNSKCDQHSFCCKCRTSISDHSELKMSKLRRINKNTS